MQQAQEAERMSRAGRLWTAKKASAGTHDIGTHPQRSWVGEQEGKIGYAPSAGRGAGMYDGDPEGFSLFVIVILTKRSLLRTIVKCHHAQQRS